MSLEDMAEKLMVATKGMRHPTCQALVVHAYFYMQPVDRIASVLKPVFCEMFDPSERRNAEREFAEMIRYAEEKTPRCHRRHCCQTSCSAGV